MRDGESITRRSSIPYFPISYKTTIKLLRPLNEMFKAASKAFPNLEAELEQMELDIKPADYIAGTVLSSILLFVLITSTILLLAFIAKPELLMEIKNVIIITVTGAIFSSFLFISSLLYPSWKSQQRAAAIDRDLLFAIRHLTVQTNAGVPLFSAMVSVSEERGALGYGELGREFGRIVKEVQGGKDLSEALDDSAARTPSRYYERIMWQLANSNRAGVPVNQALSELLDYLAEEQVIALKNYGAQLSPLALIYLLTTIVGPTLGLVFLMVISTLISLPVNEVILSFLLVILAIIQVFFIGLIRSRRPVVAM